MLTVRDVSKLTGVSVRTLHYYDAIGLLSPAVTTAAGYRLYDDTSLARLQQILLFRELEFPLRDIRRILDSPGFDREEALTEQIRLLTLKKEHVEALISYARQIRSKEGQNMDFKVFDTAKLEGYKAEAKKKWGGTAAYREYETKAADYSAEKQQALAADMMDIFREFGQNREKSPADPEAQALVKKLQAFISANYYSCTGEILAGLGQLYAAGGEMTDNIDAAGGKGTAEFAARAIAEYCR